MKEKQLCAYHKRLELCDPHHIHGRAYGEETIWLCRAIHRKVTDNPVWAIREGLMEPHKTEVKIKERRPKCKYCSTTYFSKEVGDWVCQFCPNVVGELRMGKSTAKKIVKKGDKL